jgi:hypothetical protein
MGLDMFLTGRREQFYTEKEKDPSTGYRVESRSTNLALLFWRKANAIHHWFVDYVQGGVDNCREYRVQPKDLECLRGICRNILRQKTRAKRLQEAEKALPTQTGFVFGDTGYDSYYFDALRYTVKEINKVLKLDEVKNGKLVLYYQSSW